MNVKAYLWIADTCFAITRERLIAEGEARPSDTVPPSATIAALLADAEREGWDFEKAVAVAREFGCATAETIAERQREHEQQTPLIRKIYFYGDRAGEEDILDFDDFALNHIQDEHAALSCAREILQHGESVNHDPEERVMETYVTTDREALARAVAERGAA